jgi:hypothetical protein
MIAEPYRALDGEIGYAFIEKDDNPIPRCELLSEIKDENKGLYNSLLCEVNSICWKTNDIPLPSKPDLESDDLALLKDLTQFLLVHVEFPDRRLANLLASWVMCSHISECLRHAPRIVIIGPTRCGKSRLIKVLRALAYRGLDLIDPSSASLYRIIERFHPTVFIDEYHALNRERIAELDVLFKGGYENGSRILRARREGSALDFFDCFGFMCIATKNMPPEDLQNRAILISMLEKTDNKIRRRIDYDRATSLRTRLLAFRMKVLSGLLDLTPAVEKARRIVEEPVQIEGVAILLDDRGIDIASELLVPAIHFGDFEEILQLTALSQGKAKAELLETFEASVFFALQAAIRSHKRTNLDGNLGFDASKISTREVAQQLNQDSIMEGNSQEGRGGDIPTRRVGKALRVLGFGTRRGAHNLSYLDPTTFEQVFQSNLRKYGKRGEGNALD